MKGSTWEGLYWIFYNKRPFYCGTNSYSSGVSLSQNWSSDDPPFIKRLYSDWHFESELLKEYKEYGKIVSPKTLATAVRFGIVNKKGEFQIPVINSKKDDEFNRLCASICQDLSGYMSQAPYVEEFMKRYDIRDKKVAIIILFHEVMWDTLNLLMEQHIIEKPELWSSTHPTECMAKDVFFLSK